LVLIKTKAVTLTLIAALLLMLLIISFAPSLEATDKGPQLQWTKTYPRPASTIQNVSASHYDSGSRFIQTSDDGYTIVGNTEDYAYFSHGGSKHDYSAIMIKTDSSGNMQWNKTNSVFYDASAIFQTQDQGYFMVLERGGLLGLDSQGNIQSNKTVGMPISGVQQTSDGGYVFVSANGSDAIMAKTDGNGDLLWNKTLYAFPNVFSGTITVSNIATSTDGII
jgi:hypothetical protein